MHLWGRKQNVISLKTTLDSNSYTNQGCVTLWILVRSLQFYYTNIKVIVQLWATSWDKVYCVIGNILRTWGTDQECIGTLRELNVNILKT